MECAFKNPFFAWSPPHHSVPLTLLAEPLLSEVLSIPWSILINQVYAIVCTLLPSQLPKWQQLKIHLILMI